MKEYMVPTLEVFSLETEDTVTASAVVNSIVSSDDRAAASEIQETEWSGSWT